MQPRHANLSLHTNISGQKSSQKQGVMLMCCSCTRNVKFKRDVGHVTLMLFVLSSNYV